MSAGASEQFSPLKLFFQFLPPSDGKALRHAFYNTLTLAFLGVFTLTCIAVYFILEAFIRPLIWALLIGSCLHPLKSKLSSTLKQWVNSAQASSRPLFVEAAIFPLSVLNSLLDLIYVQVVRYMKYIVIAAVVLPIAYCLFDFVPAKTHFANVVSIWNVLSKFLSYFSTTWILLAVVLYLTLLAFYWTPESHALLKLLSLPVWIAVVFHLSSLTGVFGVPLFIFFLFLVGLGSAVEIRDSLQHGSFSSKQLYRRFIASPGASPKAADDTAAAAADADGKGEGDGSASAGGYEAAQSEESAASETEQEESTAGSADGTDSSVGGGGGGGGSRRRRSRSGRFFVLLLWAHVVAYAWSHLWVLSLMPVCCVLLAARKLAGIIGSSEPVQSLYRESKSRLLRLAAERQSALAPMPIRGVCKLLLRGDMKLADILSNSIDTIVSVFVISLVLIASVFITIFLVIQVQRESIELVSMTSNVLNSTVVSASSSLLPEKDNLQKILDSMLGNAYVFGREWLSKKIHMIFDTSDYNKAKIEEQVLQLWDRLYEKLAAKNFTWTPLWSSQDLAIGNATQAAAAAAVKAAAAAGVGGGRMERQASFALSGSAWELLSALLDAKKVLEFVKENLGVLTSVLESLWVVVKGNLSLLTTVCTTVLSVLLGGGTAVLNFLVQSLVFLTSLYLLLRFSGDLYLPVQFVASLSSDKQQHPVINALYAAVNDATSGVFLASMKIACFYGLYTNLMHSVFSVNLVFVPSVLAALFGAVPFLGTYWACVPGLLELLLLQQQPALAAAFAALHVLPTYVVDAIFYGEIKGAGHPYLTGLSVAGGLYWYGLEGAIFGPILLACLLVAVNVYSIVLAPQDAAAAAAARRQPARATRSADKVRRSISLYDNKQLPPPPPPPSTTAAAAATDAAAT